MIGRRRLSHKTTHYKKDKPVLGTARCWRVPEIVRVLCQTRHLAVETCRLSRQSDRHSMTGCRRLSHKTMHYKRDKPVLGTARRWRVVELVRALCQTRHPAVETCRLSRQSQTDYRSYLHYNRQLFQQLFIAFLDRKAPRLRGHFIIFYFQFSNPAGGFINLDELRDVEIFAGLDVRQHFGNKNAPVLAMGVEV